MNIIFTFLSVMEAFMHSHIQVFILVLITCLVIRHFLSSFLAWGSHWIGCGGWSLKDHGFHKHRGRIDNNAAVDTKESRVTAFWNFLLMACRVSTWLWTFMAGGIQCWPGMLLCTHTTEPGLKEILGIFWLGLRPKGLRSLALSVQWKMSKAGLVRWLSG